MENYEQKYNKLVNAIKVLQETNPSDEGIQNWVNDNVPELTESRDEKVRKWIYNYFRGCFPTWIHPDITCGEILDWLEKQGQQKAINDTEAQYINKSALVAKIKRMIRSYNNAAKEFGNEGHKDNVLMEQCKVDACERILSFINTLETKEVNIEDAVKLWHEQHYKKKGTFDNYSGFYFARKTQLEFAKYFFELGLKTQKGE